MAASLTAVLLAGADELSELAGVADQLGTAGIADIERLQSLDRLSQHLDGLAIFLTGLADMLPDMTLDVSGVLAALKTGALANRLASRNSLDSVDSGTMELFGG